MAQCSFLKASEARNRARNDTLIWTEICEIQEAILAAIDANVYSTLITDGTPFTSLNGITTAALVSGGTGYTTTAATASINANGTGGVGALVTPIVNSGGVVSSIQVDDGGSGYTPVDATASVQAGSDLTTGQDETNYAVNRWAGGDDYAVGEVITLSENSTVTVDAINGTAVVTVAAQTQVNYDGGVNNGTFAGGGSHAVTDQITLDDGTVITVDAVSSGVVTQFTVTSSSTISFTSTTPRLQASTTGSGTGFSITPDTNNETSVGDVTQFTVASGGVDAFYLGQTITQASSAPAGGAPAGTVAIGTGFNLAPNATNATTIPHGGVTAVLTPIVTNGVITAVVVNNGGTLYSAGQPVLFSHPSPTVQASAAVAAVDGSGAIQSVTVIAGGAGYETLVPLITVTHPSGSGFVGVVNTTSGVVTSVSVQDGGFGYATLYPTLQINDATGSGAILNIIGDLTTGILTQNNLQLAAGGSGYSVTSDPVSPNTNTNATITHYNADGTQKTTNLASIALTVGDNGFGTDSTDYYAVLSGQATDAVIADQIQYILDYFTALGYNIRAQANPATGNTMQWQIIW